MNAFFILGFLLATSDANAASPSVFEDVTAAQPVCYGREYSEANLKARPKQTVQKILAKLSKNAKYNMNILSVEITLKEKKDYYISYRSTLFCENEDHCYIECDGGSVDLSKQNDGQLSFKNNGFVIRGGCGGDGNDDENGVRLPKVAVGDDEFKLTKLPAAFCQNGPDYAL